MWNGETPEAFSEAVNELVTKWKQEFEDGSFSFFSVRNYLKSAVPFAYGTRVSL